MIARRVLVVLVLAAVPALEACQKPEPPKVVPKDARVTAIGQQGIDVLVRVEATNPNRFALATRSMSAKVKLDGRYDLATVTVAHPLTLSPGKPTRVAVPMHMQWNDLQTAAALFAANRAVPYVVDGTLAVGGESFAVEVPFRAEGVLTREELVAAAVRSIPHIPGIDLRLPPPAPHAK